jgi:hypothetical protein|uniref:Cytochrome c biogenesis protein n=1 Tax=Myoviridae sp. ctshb19 TaxID=2825194 RepID=A0A8S5UG82_9CAUD|nr:MAG TPA: Cytochrome c biogenesis protein [Myoviridae sp. ctshb19]
MNHTVLVVLVMAGVLFVTTLLRGFQSKAVSSGHKTAAGITGTLMNACEILVTLFVVGATRDLPNPYYALFASVGAGAGWVAGMVLHDRVVRKRRERMKQAKRSKRQRQIERIARETFMELHEDREIV